MHNTTVNILHDDFVHYKDFADPVQGPFICEAVTNAEDEDYRKESSLEKSRNKTFEKSCEIAQGNHRVFHFHASCQDARFRERS